LDAVDVAVDKPDERSVMTYVAALYHYFTSMESGDLANQRVANLLQELAEIHAMQEDYEKKGLSFFFFFFPKKNYKLNFKFKFFNSKRSSCLDQSKN